MLNAHDMKTTIVAIKQELGCETEVSTATNTIKDNFQEFRALQSCKSWAAATNYSQITATKDMLNAHDTTTTIMAMKQELGYETEIKRATNTINNDFQESRVSQSFESWDVIARNDTQISDLPSMKTGNEEAVDLHSKTSKDSNEALAKSEQTHENYFICDICNKRYKTKKYLGKHIAQCHRQKSIKCDFCPQTFVKMKERHIHIKRVHLEKEFECELCKKKFACEQYLGRHMKSHENERRRLLSKTSDKVTVYKCETCQKDFYNEYILKRHQAVHKRQLKMQELMRCEFCLKEFTTIYRLTHHMQFHRQASFDCDICKKKFTSKNNVRRHIQHGHPIEYKFMCEMCPKRYKSMQHLNRHMLKHNDLKVSKSVENKAHAKTNFQCNKCDKEYTTKPHLRRHLLTIHIGAEDKRKARKHGCKYCGKKFLQKSDLKVHERIHTGEKPYACDECTCTFATTSSLRKHEREFHQ